MKVLIPNQLQSYTEGASEVSASGTTLADLLSDLERQFPGIRFRVVDEQDRIRKHIRMFVGGRTVNSIGVELYEADEVQIVGALSGG
jgi:sulfur-carrier protein